MKYFLFGLTMLLGCAEEPKQPANKDITVRPVQTVQGAKVALVIGNGAYSQAARLRNPVNDRNLASRFLSFR